MKHVMHTPQGNCPHPEKMPFATKAQAKKAARKRPNTRIYKCECGRYHLYTKRKRTDGT